MSIKLIFRTAMLWFAIFPMHSGGRRSGSLPLAVHSFAPNLVQFMFQLFQALMHLIKIVVDNAGEDGAGFFIELIVGPEQ